MDELSKLIPESTELSNLIKGGIGMAAELIDNVREIVRNREACNHSDNGVTNLLKKVVYNRKLSTEKLHDYLTQLRGKIKKKIDKIAVAPGEGGNFENWENDIYLEEKLFPALFPYGIGGFLSTNMLTRSNMGFSNYVKSRILSVDPKFRNDIFYVLFLLLVKEMVDIKRSEKTVFRKATKVPHLNASLVKEISKDNLMRNNSAYTAFKTIRGTSMYYEDKKKELMAYIRQLGAPTVFCTLSAAEFDWDDLAKSIYETLTNQTVTMEYIQQQDPAWRHKLIAENVVQSTLYFSKRTDKLMNLLSRVPMFEHEGVLYKVKHYFKRTEYQQRGMPHDHCMFWLEGENGETPPSMYNYEDGDYVLDDTGKRIANFASSIMSGSSNDVHCQKHKTLNKGCDDCMKLKNLVEHYQTHSHRPTCEKKNRFMRIKPDEGHGCNDGKIDADELIIKTCRFDFPKNPIDETEFILSFPKDYDKKDLKQAKEDYIRIRKYLLRLTHSKDFKTSEEWKRAK